MWNLPPPPGFVGFDPDRPGRVYVRHLPHWRQEGATYFSTFRLADSLPTWRLRELAALRADWERSTASSHVGRSRASTSQDLTNRLSTASDDHWQKLQRLLMQRVEVWLDEGGGSCILREPFAADCLERKLRHFDGVQYDLCAFVLMPNHVHLVVVPADEDGLRRTFADAHRRYTGFINARQRWTGHLLRA